MKGGLADPGENEQRRMPVGLLEQTDPKEEISSVNLYDSKPRGPKWSKSDQHRESRQNQ